MCSVSVQPDHRDRSPVQRRAVLVAVLLAAAGLAGGCGDRGKGEARRILESVVKSGKRLVVASRQLSEVVASRLDEKATDAEVRSGLAKLQEAIDQQRRESEGWKVPPTPAAEALLLAYRTNLDRRTELLDEYGPRIVDTLAGTLPRVQKEKATRELFEALGKKAELENAKLRSAQLKFAGDMGIFAFQ